MAKSEMARACWEASRTGLDTLIYAFGAGAVAVLLGFLVALCAGPGTRLRMMALSACLGLLVLPPCLPALGVIHFSAWLPWWLDWLARSRLTVCLELGLRLSPLAALFILRGWSSMSSRWCEAAALYGVSVRNYLARVVLLHLVPSLSAAFLLVSLLATADISTMLLLHSPGHGHFPLAIFTVMANAPESLVASLCLTYVALAGISALLVTHRLVSQP